MVSYGSRAVCRPYKRIVPIFTDFSFRNGSIFLLAKRTNSRSSNNCISDTFQSRQRKHGTFCSYRVVSPTYYSNLLAYPYSCPLTRHSSLFRFSPPFFTRRRDRHEPASTLILSLVLNWPVRPSRALWSTSSASVSVTQRGCCAVVECCRHYSTVRRAIRTTNKMTD